MCDIAELSAICKLCTNSQGGEIFTVTESEAVAERIKALFSRVFAKEIYCKNKNGSFRFCYDTEFFTDVVAEKLMLFGGGYEKLLKKECCKRAYLRGAFLGGGSVSDPNSRYHLEFDARYEAYAEELCGILKECGVNGKITCRKGRYIVYVNRLRACSG